MRILNTHTHARARAAHAYTHTNKTRTHPRMHVHLFARDNISGTFNISVFRESILAKTTNNKPFRFESPRLTCACVCVCVLREACWQQQQTSHIPIQIGTASSHVYFVFVFFLSDAGACHKKNTYTVGKRVAELLILPGRIYTTRHRHMQPQVIIVSTIFAKTN